VAAQVAPQAFAQMRESDPGLKLVEVWAYRELLLRARINDAVKGMLVPYADETTLPYLAAWLGLERKVIDPGDPANGVPATLEPIEDFRDRIINASSTWSVAGPRSAYVQLSLQASDLVADANAYSPNPGEVQVYILGPGGAIPDAQTIAEVDAYLSAEERRPLTDLVTVSAGAEQTIDLTATVYLASTTAQQGVIDAIGVAMDQLIEDAKGLGKQVSRSRVYAALQIPGVEYAVLAGDFTANELVPNPAQEGVSPLLVPTISAEANGIPLGVIYP